MLGGLIFAGAGLFIGGVCFLCEALEDSNKELEFDLDTLSREHELELQRQQNELVELQKRSNKAQHLEALSAKFLEFKAKSDSAYAVYRSGKKSLQKLNSQIKLAFEAKAKLKDELNLLSRGSRDFADKKSQIKSYSKFIQTQLERRDRQKHRLAEFYGTLKQLNQATKSLNLERKRFSLRA